MPRPRFTIRNLMIAVAAVAVVIWVAQQYQMILVGGCAMVVPIVLGYLAWRWTRNRPTSAAWTVGIVGVPGGLLTALFCIQPLPMVGQILAATVAFAVTPVLVGCLAAWWQSDHPRGWTRRRIVGQALIMLLTILPGSMAATLWPLHLAFRLARPEMIRLTERVARGEKVRFPREAGVYTVVEIRVDPEHPENLAILLDNNPNGETAFVRIRDAEYYRTGPLNISPTDTYIPLGDGWSYMVED